MDIKELVAETAVDLIKNENIQNKAVGLFTMLFPYTGIEKRALDIYIEEIEKSNLPTESKMIALLNAKDTIKKLKNQKAIADIAVSEVKEGTNFDEHSGVNQEWLERFMNSASFVSSEKVQLMWGKVLAGEFERPGSTPLNMIRILSEITPDYAHAFQIICSMNRLLITVDEQGRAEILRNDVVVPYQSSSEELKEIGLSLPVLGELETLGLVKLNFIAGYVAQGLPDNTILTYCGGILKEIATRELKEVPIGSVVLTEAGECLRKITETISVQGFSEMETAYMTMNGVKYKDETPFYIVEDGNGRLVLRKS